MAYFMGIDLGTSSVKVLLMAEDGSILGISSRGYPIDVPHEGFAEQNPEVWWRATADAVRETVSKSGVGADEIKCVGLSGQMHGTVLVDQIGQAIRPAIIHCDQRSQVQVNRIYETIGRDAFHAVTGNPLFPGFQLASLLWLLENEPQNYEDARCVLSPKDFIRWKLTGAMATDYSDASGTLTLDMHHNCWALDIHHRLGLDSHKLPQIRNSMDIAGEITGAAAVETGLRKGTPVILGGANQPMQALGNGAVLHGTMTSNIGTGGQVYTPTPSAVMDESQKTFTFHGLQPGAHYLMGAILNAGLCLRWLNEKVLRYGDFEALSRAAESVPPLSHSLLFLPYLTGERVPFGTHTLKGSFFGLTLVHDGAAMARAVMEGVTFALRERFEALESLCGIDHVIASGGGANSGLWLQIQADVYNREIYKSNMTEQACVGAAMAAGTGIGIYSDLREACRAVIRLNVQPIVPIKENVLLYDGQYTRYLELARRNSQEL